jgi:hypothetical protein
VRRLLAAVAAIALGAACSTGDGRQLADPDPDLTRVTTTAPTATGEATRGAAAPDLAIPVSSAAGDGLTVSSRDFAPGAVMPVEHSCDGDERPPVITWAGNKAAAPLALVVRDADAQGAVQWLITDLAGTTGTVGAEGTAPGTTLDNSFGITGWTGPCPDDGLEHRYVFTLYSLPAGASIPTATDAEAAVRALEEEHLDATTLVGLYARP